MLLVVAFVVDRIVRAVEPSAAHPTGNAATTTHGAASAGRGDAGRGRAGRGGGSHAAGGQVTAQVKPVAGPAAPGGTRVVLSAVGDLELGTSGDLPPDPVHYLDPVGSALAAPIVFGNLEGTLSTGPSTKCAGAKDCFAFQDPPSYASILRADGFDVLNSANNHSDDFGPAGVTQTSDALRAAGIVQAGLPGQIGLVHDGRTAVAFVDFAPYQTTNDLLDLPAARTLIDRARTLAPVVVVYMHAGAEGATADHVTGSEEHYLGEDRGNPEAFAEAAINDGASAVIASGPHVLRGMEFYRGHLIAYSLGDFAGYGNFATNGPLDLSGILHLTLSPSGAFVRASWTSLILNTVGEPAVDPSGASATFVDRLSSSDFGARAARIGRDGAILPATTSG